MQYVKILIVVSLSFGNLYSAIAIITYIEGFNDQTVRVMYYNNKLVINYFSLVLREMFKFSYASYL